MILLLYERAMGEHLDATPAVQREVAMGRLRTIAQAEYQHLVEQITVTPEEEDAFYKANLQNLEERDIREVAVIRKPKGGAANALGLDDDVARERAETIHKALVSGADPAKLIQDYAIANTVLIDAKPNRIRRGQLIGTLDKPAFELKDGEVSGVVEAPQAFVFIQVVGRHTPELKEVTPEIENALRQQKMNAQMQQLRQAAAIWMDDQYFATPKAVTPPAPTVPPATPPKP
jgi:parvulin-like peptidyl-prolyl isomerase